MKHYKKSLIVLTIILLSVTPVSAQQADYPLSGTSLVASSNTVAPLTTPNNYAATIQAAENQIKSLDVQINAAKSTLTNAEQSLLAVHKKYPYCVVSGDVITYSPDFIVYGTAIGDYLMLSDCYIQIVNTSEQSKMLSVFSEQRFFLKWTQNKIGVSIAVFGPPPKELSDLDSVYLKAKADYENLVKQRNAALLKKEDALAQQAGYSVVYSANGDRYVGSVKDNKREGKGKLFLSNGDYYEGDFKNDVYDGVGTLKTGYLPATELFSARYRNEYIGEFKDGLYNGKGKMEFNRNGFRYFKYNGSFKNGYKDGYGELTHSMDSSIDYKGNFKYDIYLGPVGDNSKSAFLDENIGYSIQYPAEWGTPKTEYNSTKGSFGTLTTFFKNDNASIVSYGNLFSGTLDEFAAKLGLGYGSEYYNMYGKKGYLYSPSFDYSGYGYRSRLFIMVKEDHQACCIEFKYNDDISSDELYELNDIFEDMIDTIILTAGPVG